MVTSAIGRQGEWNVETTFASGKTPIPQESEVRLCVRYLNLSKKMHWVLLRLFSNKNIINEKSLLSADYNELMLLFLREYAKAMFPLHNRFMIYAGRMPPPIGTPAWWWHNRSVCIIYEFFENLHNKYQYTSVTYDLFPPRLIENWFLNYVHLLLH